MVSVTYSFFFPFFPVVAFAYLIHKRFVALPRKDSTGILLRVLSAAMAVGYAATAWGFVSHSVVLRQWVTGLCAGLLFLHGFSMIFAGRFVHDYAATTKPASQKSAMNMYGLSLILALVGHVGFGTLSFIFSVGGDWCADKTTMACCASDCYSNTPHPGLLNFSYFPGLTVWTISYVIFFIINMIWWNKYDSPTKDD